MAMQINLVQINLMQINLAQINFMQAQRLQNEWVLLLLCVGFTFLLLIKKQVWGCAKNERPAFRNMFTGSMYAGSMYATENRTNLTFFAGDFDEDSDMKIIPSGSTSYLIKDPTEDEIDIYFRHKHNGNIQLAKLLGEKLAEQVAAYHFDWTSKELLGENQDTEKSRYNQQLFDEQGRMLFVYVMEKSAREWAPDSILSQMVVASLGDSVEQHFRGFYRRMEECRAYTMYKLCGARRSGVERSMGEAFAHMVGHKENEVYIAAGSQIYVEMEKSCKELLASANLEE